MMGHATVPRISAAVYQPFRYRHRSRLFAFFACQAQTVGSGRYVAFAKPYDRHTDRLEQILPNPWGDAHRTSFDCDVVSAAESTRPDTSAAI